ncbi:MAG: Replicative DNA helicase [Candidatus Aminicenantes bacterium ADurb.Bin508]|nr:MAG: Replicative DNA helicase [Candidatus Aminicenantes bacterium ADurb.Bin508]
MVPEPYLVADLEQDILLAKAGLETGYAALDRLLSIPQGAITILAGRPGHGKTTLQLNLLARMLKKYPEMAFAFFSYEESRRALALKLIMLEAGETLDQDHNFKEERQTRPAIEEAISLYESWTSSGRLLLSDQRLSAEDLSVTIGHLSGRGPLGAVFVDYIQKVPLQGASSGQRYQDIQRVSGLLLDTAVRLDLPVILGAQLGRDKDSKDKVRLDNLRESGDIEQDANLVLGLLNKTRQKEEDDGVRDSSRSVELDIRVLKNRAGQAETTAGLMLDRPILRILDKATDHAVEAFR